MGFDVEMVVAQTACKGKVADVVDGFGVNAGIAFLRIAQGCAEEYRRFDFLMAVVDTVFD